MCKPGTLRGASVLRSERIFFDISTHELVSTQRILKAIEYCGAQQVVMGSDTPYGQLNFTQPFSQCNKCERGTHATSVNVAPMQQV